MERKKTTECNEVGIVIPAYNEETEIGPVIGRLREVLEKATFTWEIVVVDDGSTDKTSQVLEELGIKVIRHELNRGYGAALKTGVRSLNTEWFAIIDADGTYPEEELLNIAKYMKESDMIIGARTGNKVHIPLIRRPAKAFMRKFAGYIAGRPIPDLNSGLRLIKRELVLKFIHLLPDGFSFTTTISLALLVDGYRVKYVPINYLHRKGKSKIRPIYDTLNFMSLITRTGIYFKPLKVFFPIALLMLFAGLGVFLFSMYYMDRVLDTTSTIFIMTGVQTFIMGLIAELIIRRSP